MEQMRARELQPTLLAPCAPQPAAGTVALQVGRGDTLLLSTDIALDDGDRHVLRLRQAGGARCSSSAEANVVEVAWPVAANLQA